MAIEPFNYQKRTNIEEHNQIVDKLNEVVDAVNNIDPSGQGLEPRVTALETDVTGLGVRVDSVESKNLQQDTAIQRAEGNITALETDVTNLGTRVDSVESKNTQQDTAINDIKTDAETTKNRVGAAEGDIATLTGQVGQLQTDITNLDGRVTDIDGRLTTLAGNYTTLGGRVDSLDSQVGQLNTEIGGLETGKVNIAQGTENNGKYLGVGADGNVTLKDIVIPQGKSYKMAYSNAFTSVGISTPNTTTTIDGTEGYLFKVTHSLPSRIRTGAVVKMTLGDKTYYASRISVNGVNGTTMSDVGILYNIDFTGSSVNIAIWIPAVLVGEATLLSVYFNEYTWNLEVEA